MKRRSRQARRTAKFCETLEPRVLLAGDGRPTPTLHASPITQWGSTYVFKVAYTDDVAVDVQTLDDGDLTITGPNGYLRRARFWRATGSGATVTGWYKISAPGGVWDAVDNGTYSVALNAFQVRDTAGNSARQGTFGSFGVDVMQYPSIVSSNMPTKGLIGVDVTRFGAVPNDGIDDTAAIQRAIDSLPRDGDGVPDVVSPIGGIVSFPKGTFNTSAPLRLPTAVRLRGMGESSIIANTSANPGEGAVELFSYAGHGFNIRAGVENLSITTTVAKGVFATPLRGDLVSLRLNDLTISAGGAAIDLRNVRTYQLDIRNVSVRDPGSTALWLGPPNDAWISNVNRISGFSVLGRARDGFRAELGMVVLGGDVSVDGLTIAETAAPVIPLYATGAPTLTQMQLFPTHNLPGNVLARFENCTTVDLDRVTSISASRRIDVRNTHDVLIESVVLAPNARLLDAITLDASSHVTIRALRSSTNPGSITDARFTVRTVAGLDAEPIWLANYGEPMRPVSHTVADVRNFGAVPNDGIDDTAAIQAAINWLPRGDGLPRSGTSVGGLVLFGAGTYQTSGPITIPSGVWLRGQGNSTIVRNTSSDSTRGAFEFIGGYSHGFNAGAAIEDMSIWTAFAMGIRAAEGITSGLVDARLAGLQISAGYRAMDLSAVRTYHTTIVNVMVSDPGSTALWLGDTDGYSADNRIIGLQLQGTTRGGFVREKALVVLGGEYLFQNGWLEQPGGTLLPLSISGTATIRGLWLEYPPESLINRIVAQFENTTSVYMDRLTHVEPTRRLNFVNAKGVRIDMLDISGSTTPLQDCIVMDATSQLSVGMVTAQRDSGLLDHPRVVVESAYNILDKIVIPNRVPSATQNLLADPQFLSLNNKPRGDGFGGGWTIAWGDSLGAVQGTSTIEQTSDGPRLKIVITSNPYNRSVAVSAKLNVPASAIGKQAIARWRIDGSGTAMVYQRNYSHQFSARAMNSTTSARTPVNLQGADQIVFVLPSAPGTYYISGVSLALI